MGNELGEYIKTNRGDMSIREAAKAVGLSHTRLGDIEKGVDRRTGKKTNPHPKTLKKIAHGLNLDYIKLMRLSNYI